MTASYRQAAHFLRRIIIGIDMKPRIKTVIDVLALFGAVVLLAYLTFVTYLKHEMAQDMRRLRAEAPSKIVAIRPVEVMLNSNIRETSQNPNVYILQPREEAKVLDVSCVPFAGNCYYKIQLKNGVIGFVTLMRGNTQYLGIR